MAPLGNLSDSLSNVSSRWQSYKASSGDKAGEKFMFSSTAALGSDYILGYELHQILRSLPVFHIVLIKTNSEFSGTKKENMHE